MQNLHLEKQQTYTAQSVRADTVHERKYTISILFCRCNSLHSDSSLSRTAMAT